MIIDQQRQYKENVTKDAKTKFLPQFAISHAIFPKIMNAFTTKQAWKILQDKFQGLGKVR